MAARKDAFESAKIFGYKKEDAITDWTQLQEDALEEANIGMISQDKEQILNYAKMVILFGLKARAPYYTGNLMMRGFKDKMKGKRGCDITILAPGLTNKKTRRKLPRYGWQTDMLDRLQFYNEDGDYIDVPNKNKGWVERSLSDSLEKIINKFEGEIQDENI